MTPFGRKIGRTNDYTFAAREDFSSTLAKSHTKDRESRTYRGNGRGGRTADPVGSGGGKNAPFWAAFSTVYFGGFFRESHDPLKRTEDVSEADAPPGRGGGVPPCPGDRSLAGQTSHKYSFQGPLRDYATVTCGSLVAPRPYNDRGA